jgi:hypothetical protein
MDPTKMTLAAAGAGLLLAAITLGPLTIVAFQAYDGNEEDLLEEMNLRVPAAQQAFAKAFASENPARSEETMRMTMEVLAPGEIKIGGAELNVDHRSDEFYFTFLLDIKQMADAYGLDWEEITNSSHTYESNQTQQNGTYDPDDPGDDWGDEMFDAMFGGFFNDISDEALERLEFTFARKDDKLTFIFGPIFDFSMWSFDDDETPTPEMSVSEADSGDEDPMGGLLGEKDLARFTEAEHAEHEVEASTWEGEPTWKITTTLIEDGLEETAVFHLRQSDMAPLAVDMHIQLIDEDSFLSILEETHPGTNITGIEDFGYSMIMRFQYGGPVDFEMPYSENRFSVTVQTNDVVTDDTIIRTLREDHKDLVALDGLEVHVVVLDEYATFNNMAPVVTETLAVLPLQEALENETEDFRITYEDNDGDGLLSPGDRIILEAKTDGAIWENETHSVYVLIWDTWAGEYEGAPGPGLIVVLGGLLLAYATLRARRRQ